MTALDEALTYCERLLRILDRAGGYTTTEQQQTMRGARRLVAEAKACGVLPVTTTRDERNTR